MTTSSFQETRRWALVLLGTFLCSSLAGWFLPDGVNAVARLLGDVPAPETPLVRFFCFALLFAIALLIELVLWTRQRANDALAAIERILMSDLASGARAATEGAVLRTILPSASATPGQAGHAARLLTTFGGIVSAVPPRLLSGYSVLVDAGLAAISDDIRTVAAEGRKVDIQQHIEISRRLAYQATSFTQINRKTFQVPDQWTQEWLVLVDELGMRSIATEYIVLAPFAELRSRDHEIRGMSTYLTQRGWTMRCCQVERVEDALGGAIPTPANLDLYDDDIAKLQTPPEGEYRGGIRLQMQLVDLGRHPSISRFVVAVKQFAEPVAP